MWCLINHADSRKTTQLLCSFTKMELLCVLVLCLCGSVIATPYGYGVKGGAFAKADASSAAGAFGGLAPHNVPPGAGYSGSFSSSKSSSSSSSSSSASSSSSSFSFGGSGSSGAPGHSGFGGCSTGTCQGNSNNGADIGSEAANGQADAESIGIEGSNGADSTCVGTDCPNKKSNCGSGNCNSGLTTDSKCTSGQCQHGVQPNSPSTENDNDIQVFKYPSPTQSAHGPQSSYPNKPSSGCSYGNCATTSHNTETSHPSHAVNSDHLGSTKCSTPNCDNKYPNPLANDNAPQPSISSYDKSPSPTYSNYPTEPEKLPSSYNVPIGSYLAPGPKPSCTSGNCDSNNQLAPETGNKCTSPNCAPSSNSPKCQSGQCAYGKPETQYPNANIPGFSFGSSGVSPPHRPLGSINCKTPNCDVTPSSPSGEGPSNTFPNSGYSGPPGNYHSHPPSTVYESPKYPQPLGELSPPISPNANYPSSGVSKPSYAGPSYSHTSPQGAATYPSPFSPPYNSASPPHANSNHYAPVPSFNSPASHGAPVASFINTSPPNHGNIPSSIAPISSYTPSAGCTSPNCQVNGLPSNPSIVSPYNPNIATVPKKDKLPPYTGGFGGPAGFLKPNDFSPPSRPVPSQPSASPPSPPVSHSTANHPLAPPNGGHIYPTPVSGCKSGICSQTPNHEEPHSSKPSCSNGNCGSVPALSSPYNTGFQGSSNGNPPSPVSCTSPNCHSNGYSSIPSNGLSHQPSNGAVPSNDKVPAYTGSFGGPSGLLKPNDYSTSSKPGLPHAPVLPGSPAVSTPSEIHPTVPSTPIGHVANKPLNTAGCSGGVCTPTSSSNGPHSHEPDCSTGNCPSVSGSSPTHTTGFQGSSNAFANAAASSSAQVYTGGFGGPPGLLKPYDNGNVNGAHGQNPHGKHSSQPLNGDSPSSFDHKQISGSAAQANAISSSNSLAYTNGNYNPSGSNLPNSGTKGGNGCGGGCGNGGHGYQGLNSGTNDPWGSSAGALSSAAASSKSLSGSLSGNGGYGGSFASSSASAHASAGAATKGGYGR